MQFLGPQPALPEMGPAETQNFFKRVFRNFLGAFADGGRPLVIFLDDMQWADNATLDLLEATLSANDVRYVFFLLAYGDNEVPATHPFALMMERLGNLELGLKEVELAPLSAESISLLVCETLRCEAERAAPLVRLIAGKTAGNPFFVSEFIKTLHRENLLLFNEEKRQWTWTQATIEAQNITDNVVQLMIDRLRRLDARTGKALSFAACIGNTQHPGPRPG